MFELTVFKKDVIITFGCGLPLNFMTGEKTNEFLYRTFIQNH